MKKFEDYVKEKIVKRITPDINRAIYLKKEALDRRKFILDLVNSKGISQENANYIIELAYGVVMELIRSKMLEKGFNASGNFAHEAEISFLSKLGFSEDKIIFANDLRKARNRILYYGRKFDKEFALKVLEFMEEVVKKLGKI